MKRDREKNKEKHTHTQRGGERERVQCAGKLTAQHIQAKWYREKERRLLE